MSTIGKLNLSNDQLIAMLLDLGHDVPWSLIEDAAHRDETMEAELIAILDDEESWVLPADDPGRWLPIHAIMILGLRGTEAAGLAIARFFPGQASIVF